MNFQISPCPKGEGRDVKDDMGAIHGCDHIREPQNVIKSHSDLLSLLLLVWKINTFN